MRDDRLVILQTVAFLFHRWSLPPSLPLSLPRPSSVSANAKQELVAELTTSNLKSSLVRRAQSLPRIEDSKDKRLLHAVKNQQVRLRPPSLFFISTLLPLSFLFSLLLSSSLFPRTLPCPFLALPLFPREMSSFASPLPSKDVTLRFLSSLYNCHHGPLPCPHFPPSLPPSLPF